MTAIAVELQTNDSRDASLARSGRSLNAVILENTGKSASVFITSILTSNIQYGNTSDENSNPTGETAEAPKGSAAPRQ